MRHLCLFYSNDAHPNFQRAGSGTKVASERSVMNKRLKIFKLPAKILLVIFALVAIAVVIAPRLINLEAVKKSIRDQVSHEIGSQIKFRSLDLSFLPRPHLVIRKVELEIPKSFTIRIHRMKVYPNIRSLFGGRIKIDRIALEYAEYQMKLPRINENASHRNKISAVEDILAAMARAIRGLPEFKLPELNLKIKYGKVNLVDPFGNTFKLSEVRADYNRRPSKLDFSIGCKSNLWDRVDIRGSLNPLNFSGNVHVELSRFRPQSLMAYLIHDSTLKVLDARASMTVDVDLDGSGKLQAAFSGAVPTLALGSGDELMKIEGGRLRGDLQFGDRQIELSIAELGLDDPALDAEARFSYDEDLGDMRLSVNGMRIDAASVRRVALTLLGKFKVVRDIFNIIRGGYVPWMSVDMRGQTIATLGDLDHIVIRGRMSRGMIFIPKAELNLEDVSGDALISGGVLQADKLAARMGKSAGKGGKMTLGLHKSLIPFYLEIGVNADLAQLPPVLNRVVDDKAFLRELSLIDDVNGTATGTLILEKNPTRLTARVEASDIQLSARYRRLSEIVKIAGGRFTYGARRIGFEHFNATVGRSSFVNPSITVDWHGTPALQANFQSAIVDFDEFHSWLRSLGLSNGYIRNIQTVEGRVTAANLKIKGPMFIPRQWRIQTRGVVEKLILTSQKLPDSLKITQGQFTWRGTRIEIRNLDAAMGRSTVTRLSAGYNTRNPSTFEAHSPSMKLFVPEIYPWLSSVAGSSPVLKDISLSDGTVILTDLDLKGPLYHPSRWRYDAACRMQNLVLVSPALGEPLTVSSAAFKVICTSNLQADGARIRMQAVDLIWADKHLTLGGDAVLRENETLLELVVNAEALDWRQIKHLIDYIAQRHGNPGQHTATGNLLGRVKIHVERFNYEPFSIHPLIAELLLEPQKIAVGINQADVCGISFQGGFQIHDQTLEISLFPTAADQDLAASIACFTDRENLAAGTFDLDGALQARSKPDELPRSLTGTLTFSADAGRIYRFGLLAKLLAILNVTEIYRGQLPDLTGKGFAYNEMKIRADLKDGRFTMKECAIDGLSMGIACEGDIDLVANKIDLIILVAPFKTMDRIVKFLPLVKQILGGKLISIPFRATGDLNDPAVMPLPPAAVGSEVLGILERTLKLPITIIQPLFSQGESKKQDHDADQIPHPAGPP